MDVREEQAERKLSEGAAVFSFVDVGPARADGEDEVRCIECRTAYAPCDEQRRGVGGCPSCGCLSWVAAAFLPARTPDDGDAARAALHAHTATA